MKRRVGYWLAGLAAFAIPVHGQEGGGYRWARISLVQAAVVGIDAGRADGVRAWSRLEVIRRGVPVALLRVSSLGDHQARCELASRGTVAVGDSVRYLPVGLPGESPPVASQPSPARGATAPPPVTRADSGVRRPAPQPPAPQPPANPPPSRRAPPVPTPAVTPPATSPPVVAVSPPPAAPLPAAEPRQGPAPSGHPRTARVTYLTTATAYIDAGKAEGLAEGSRVDVLHVGASVAELKVSFVSTHQASCQIVTESATLAVGDSVRFEPVIAQAVSTDSTRAVAERQVATPATAPGWSSRYGRLRGRVGLYYLRVEQRDSFGGWFTQPSGEIRVTGTGLGGSPIGLVADIRSRRLTQGLPSGPNSTVDQNRVYQALLFWQAPGSPFRFTTGRQYAPGISSVGLLDGASAEASLATWDYGVFGGMSPDPVTLGFSGDSLTQLGGYIRRHNRIGSFSHWSLTAGVSGSYVNWQTNREFLYAQGNYQSRRLSIYAVQEVDYYRSWRRVGTSEKMLSPTSTFANVQYQVTDAVSVNAGVDNRRNVRVYYYVVNPAILFDDTFRRGVWAGAAARFARHFQLTVDARANHDATLGEANTYTVGLGADRITPLGVSLRSRTTRYTTGDRQGWLNSLSLGFEPLGVGNVQLTTGWRAEHDTSTAPTLNVRWLSADVDVSLSRSLFAILSAYRERGGIEAHDLLYTGLSYRF